MKALVSIPFKRESVFRVKGLPELIESALQVSIPFKRESVFRVLVEYGEERVIERSFQFPSNGKVYSEFYGL